MNKVRFSAKITLAAGMVLATAFSFSCSGDDSGGDGGSSSSGDGKGNDINNYRTVVIGNQTWMAENLNYAVAGSKCYGEGGQVLIDYDENDNPITKTLSQSEVQANCTKYGRLYDWEMAKTVCPAGWHLPSKEELEVLVAYIGIKSGGEKLKAKSGWNWNDEDNISGNGTDEFGFSALPGGMGRNRSGRSVFNNVGFVGYWQSSSEADSDHAFIFAAINLVSEIVGDRKLKSDFYSVRCLQDGGDDSGGGSSSSGGGGGNNTLEEVVIGSQIWSNRNLNIDVAGSKCYYNDPVYCAKYGRLYDWEMAKTVCPAGWHLPTQAEWDELSSYVESKGDCNSCDATKLKASSDWGNIGTDDYEFSALPGGRGNRDSDEVSFYGNGANGYWWTASEYDGYRAYCRTIYYNEEYVRLEDRDKSYSLSVRCVKDEAENNQGGTDD